MRAGELLTLLGPSGCGKTTTLRLIAGFERPTAGRILLEGRDITALAPQRRRIGMVFQSYALFPHLDVFENVAFGLRAHGVPRREVPARVEAALARVDLAGFGRRRVQQLSGGQQQRVALARALAPEPPVLLLDEPLSNLDAALRERTRTELRALLQRLGITAVFVTHDQEEAFALSDRIAILDAGRLQQVGPPETLYFEPANPFVASFLGRAGFVEARVASVSGDELCCTLPGGVTWPARLAGAGGGPEPGAAREGAAVLLMLRPESLELLPAPAPGEAAAPADLPGIVRERRFAGAATDYRVEVAQTGAGARPLQLLVQAAADAAAPGDPVRIRPRAPARAFPRR